LFHSCPLLAMFRVESRTQCHILSRDSYLTARSGAGPITASNAGFPRGGVLFDADLRNRAFAIVLKTA
jgi:hypothetical protein